MHPLTRARRTIALPLCPAPVLAQKLFAMKIMDKSEAYNKVLWENETLILQTLRHPNILEWVESYEDKKTFHILTTLCLGGELFDRVKNGSFSEKVASRLAREMLQALDYCHKHNVVHRGRNRWECTIGMMRQHLPSRCVKTGRPRADPLFLPSFPADLKPENYVFTSQDESSPMRLIDFGCAKVAADDEVISDVAGSPYYCSPEVGSPQAGAGGGKARA